MKLISLFSFVFIFFSCTSVEQKAMKEYSKGVQSKLRSQAPDLKKCYDFQKSKEPQEESLVYLDFEILKDGTVADPSIYAESFTLEKVAEKCLVAVLENSKFEPIPEDGSVKVHQPMYFKN